MSQLILNFFRKDDSLKLSVTATGHCNYEDHIEVDGKRAYELLVLSNNRKKNLNKYCSGLKTLLRNHSDIVRLEDSQPMTFCWRVNDVTYLSTSLFFEYYMSNLSNCLSKIKDALQSDLDSTPYKEAKETLIHLRGMFDEWNTQLLILPHTPHVVSLDFLQSLLCFTHGCHTLQVTPKLKDKSYGVALRTTMDSFGRVWPQHEYGEAPAPLLGQPRLALRLRARRRISRGFGKVDCLLEPKVPVEHAFQKCFLTKKILDKVNDLEHKLMDDIDVLKNTYYAEETDLKTSRYQRAII